MTTTFMSGLSGCGGSDIGAMAAGWKHVGGIEIDPKPAAMYRANVGHCYEMPIQEIGWCTFDGVDAMLFSPVCTRMSRANVAGKENELDIEVAAAIARLVHFCKPKFVVIENVREYIGSTSYGVIVDELVSSGYGVDTQVINAANCGVAQTRVRMILRAVRGGTVPKWHMTHSKGGVGGLLPWNGWYRAVVDLLPSCKPSKFADWQLPHVEKYLKEHGVDNWLIDGQNSSRELGFRDGAEPSYTVTGQGGGGMPRAILVDGSANDNGASLTIREACAPSHTVKASVLKSNSRVLIDRGRVVSLNYQCLARFQSFPDTYQWGDNRGVAAKAIGNAVPPRLMQSACESLMGATVDAGYRELVQGRLF